jgi:anti-sigma factor RsiW
VTCEQLVELITAFLDNALDHRRRDRFERHLSRCRGCRTYLQQFRVAVDVVGRIGDDDIHADFRDRLLAAFGHWG